MSEKDNKNDTAIENQLANNEKKEDINSKGKNKSKGNNGLLGTLKYGIAALSFVSFITTSNGLQKIITDEKLAPYLISFGIQIIVLIIGTQLVNIIKIIADIKSVKTIVKRIIAISVIIPYLSAVGFSSFFSYVYLANNAYENVKETDYNIAIENFFNEEIINIKSLNDAAGNIILKQIQSFVPSFKEILADFSNYYGGNIDSARSQIVKNETATFNTSQIYDPEFFIYSFNANRRQAERLRGYVITFETVAKNYSVYYNSYEMQYNRIQNRTSEDLISSASTNIEEIEASITSINQQISSINEINDPNPEFDDALRTPISTISSYFEALKISFGDLKNFYNSLSEESIRYEDINLEDVYNTIYSTVHVDDDKVDGAVNSLVLTINAYIDANDMENLNDEVLSSLSTSIKCLGEFQKYKELDGKINDFEESVLKQIYIIDYETTTEKSETTTSDDANQSESEVEPTTEITTEETTQNPPSNEETSTTNPDDPIKEVGVDEWNQYRRKNIGKFIDLIKSLPDFDTILNAYDNSSDLREYVNKLNKNIDYKVDTLEKAYKLNRQNLENISSIETAWNFLLSDFRYMAIYCVFVALFLDLSSLFVGVFTYFYEKVQKEEKDKKDKQEKQI